MLVEFARHAQPRLAEKRSKNQAELDALVTCRRQLAGARAQQQTNRRGATVSRAALRSIDAVIAAFDKQIDSLDRQIRKLIESDDDLHEADRILRSAPAGIGPVASSTLIGELNELGAAPTASASAPSPASRRSMTTPAHARASGSFAADAPTCAASCTWPPSPPSAATR